ncbi:MAG TPA: DUF3391 domain-containing protein [Verrucomicrobiae bacterium]|nr:DUF3391 domain-containing protein [Verrucomicrobiae bacterium]
MHSEELSTRKRVPVSGIKPGMYVVGLDRSWLQTPFWFHRKLIKCVEDIDTLKKHGIREVLIDISRGADVVSAGRSLMLGLATAKRAKLPVR